MSQQSSIYPYTLTDEEIDKIYNKGPIVNIDHQQRLPYFHKYFVDSILKVNKQSSIQFLLNLLYNDIGRGIYYIPVSDVDELFQLLFNILPNLEKIQENSQNVDLLFKISTEFMSRFYHSLYPYFYDIDNPESIFTYDPLFIINFISGMTDKSFDTTTNRQYLKGLQENGTVKKILDLLFDLYFKGFENEKVSKVIFESLKIFDYNFIYDYLKTKPFFGSNSSIFVNEEKKIYFRMNFLISFYRNYIELCFCERNAIPTLKDTENSNLTEFLYSNHIFNFIESFAYSFTNQLISEGRLIGIENPFLVDQKAIQNETFNFYPTKADDEDLVQLTCLISLFPKDFELLETVYDFFSLYSSLLYILQGFICLSDRYFIEFFDYCKKSEIKRQILYNKMAEVINCRLEGNFKPDEETKKSIDFDDDSYICFLIENSDVNELFDSLHLDDIDKINRILNIIIRYNNQSSYRSTVLYLSKYATNIETIQNYIKALLACNWRYDYSDISQICKDITFFLLKEPNIFESVDFKTILKFVKKFPISEGELDLQFLVDIIQTAIEKLDLYKILIISVAIRNFKFNKLSQKVYQFLVQKLSKIKSDELNDNLINFIVTISPLLTSFTFTDENIVNIIKSCISYIGENQGEYLLIGNLDSNSIQLKSSDEAKINLTCCLINTFGFELSEMYLNTLSGLMDGYGMCIEILNALSKIIGCLIPFVEKQSQLSNEIQATNDKIFQITKILIENTPFDEITTTDQNDSSSNFKRRMYAIRSSKYIKIHFGLIKKKIDDVDDDDVFTCRYSYKMNGEKIDDRFGYSLNRKNKDGNNIHGYSKIVISFIQNIANFTIELLNKFGTNTEFVDLYKKILNLAEMKSLIDKEIINNFFN